jgi:hypothetical protein
MTTVLCSIHGLSAVPGIKLYSAKIKALDAAAPENQGPEATIAGG